MPDLIAHSVDYSKVECEKTERILKSALGPFPVPVEEPTPEKRFQIDIKATLRRRAKEWQSWQDN